METNADSNPNAESGSKGKNLPTVAWIMIFSLFNLGIYYFLSPITFHGRHPYLCVKASTMVYFMESFLWCFFVFYGLYAEVRDGGCHEEKYPVLANSFEPFIVVALTSLVWGAEVNGIAEYLKEVTHWIGF